MASGRVIPGSFDSRLWKGDVPARRLDWKYGTESRMETYAQDIDTRVQLLQALIRGYVTRRKFSLANGHQCEQPQVGDKDKSHFQTKDNTEEVKQHVYDLNQNIHEVDGDELSSACESSVRSIDRMTMIKGPHDQDDFYADIRVSNQKSGLDDPLFTKRKITELPVGWSVASDSLERPCFINDTGDTTHFHPHQMDAIKAYGDWFDLTDAWRCIGHPQYQQSKDVNRVFDNTIELLALEYQAKRHPTWVIDRWASQGPDSENASGYWIELPSSTQCYGLCAVCCHINFRYMMTWDCYTVPISRLYFKPLHAVLQETGCSFCRMVAQCAAQRLSPKLIQKVKQNSKVIRSVLAHSDDSLAPMYIRFENAKVSAYKDEKVPIHRILADYEALPENKWDGFPYLRNWTAVEETVNLNTVDLFLRETDSQWAQYKTQTLPTFAEASSSRTSGNIPIQSAQMTVIDIWTECLVDLKPDRYIALSYVWGGPQSHMNVRKNTEQLHKPHALTSYGPLPRSIQDAMEFVRLIGERYLWVDSLCIVQDDDIHKAAQILNMANIYRQAYFTIVAAYGYNAHAGLPGVSSGTRKYQIRERIQGWTLASALPTFEEVVQGSIWNTRGWTYQESELCSRYIMFTEYQVYFRCGGAIYAEEQKLIPQCGNRSYSIQTKERPNFLSYCRAVTDYTRRKLGYDQDAADAFQGIAGLLQPLFGSQFIFGLPEAELDLALLWIPASKSMRRRTGLPSWSWCGWAGPVQYFWWTDHLLDDVSRVQWQDAVTQEYFTSDGYRSGRRTGSSSSRTWEKGRTRERFIYDMPYWYNKSSPDIHFLHPIEPQEERKTRCFLQNGSNELQFKALTARFTLKSPSEWFCSDWMSIVDDNGFAAGFVYLNQKSDSSGPLSPISTGEETPPPWPSPPPPPPPPPHSELEGGVPIPASSSIPTPPSPTDFNFSPFASTYRNDEVVEFICLSRRRSCEWDTQWDTTWDTDFEKGPSFSEDEKDVPDRAMLYPGQKDLEDSEDHFDQRRYNVHMSFPLYNVMAIERIGDRDDVSERIGIGIIHITAFWQAKPEWKHIVLG